MNPIAAFQRPCNLQRSSPFFTKFPGEVRATIYKEALQSYEDKTRAYDIDTSYRRPNYLAPMRTDCALLQTCQNIYNEAWFYPWVSTVYTFWLAWDGRRPDGVEHKIDEFRTALATLYDQHGQIFLSHIRIFAQLCEMGQLVRILRMPYFYPRVMTITIRHHDWWNWEDNRPLSIDDEVCTRWDFPASLVEIRMELESLQRKQDEINWVADRMMEHWWFRRTDGIIMVADTADFGVETWRGSSTWEGQRWFRDEVAPHVLEYYVKTVVWRPSHKTAEELEKPQPIDATDRFPQVDLPNRYDEDDSEDPDESGEGEQDEDSEQEGEEDIDDQDEHGLSSGSASSESQREASTSR